MKVIKLILILGLLVPATLGAQTYGDYKLYASYDFEQSANDGQGNTTLNTGGATLVYDNVRQSNVLSIALGQMATMQPAPIVGDTLSLAFWYKRSSGDTNPGWQHIFEFYTPNGDGSNIYLMPEYGYDTSKSGLVCDVRAFRQDIWQSMTGAKFNADNSWHHITVVIAGTMWYYYVDGTLQSTQYIFGSLSLINPYALYFGMSPRDDRQHACSFDDLRIYHYPLSDSQVKQLYNGETITDPQEQDAPITFHFDGDLEEISNRIGLSGYNYELVKDATRGQIVSIYEGGQLNFSKNFIPESSSSISFLFKKETITEADNGKYIFQCTNSGDETKKYGLKLQVEGTTAKLVLEGVSNGTLKTATGKSSIEAGEWYAITINHTISAGTTKGTMRVYQNGTQATGLTNLETYNLGFDKWSLGATDASQTAAVMLDELIIYNEAISTTEITSYYQSNLTSVTLTVDCNDKHQTIRNIGASDAWNAQLIGLHWPEAKRNKLAELLFSKEFDENGNPKGIGLSCWRFNIGAGSAEQGEASKITEEAKRTECFLNADGTYNWDKQKGQQWFLEQAIKKYEVEDLVGFMNSAPVYYTRNGYAFNEDKNWNYNLKNGYEDKFAKFTADVIEHFDAEGIHFDYISPVNEPQYEWRNEDGTGGQEGSPATNQDIADIVKAMSTEFNSRGLTTQLFVGEAGAIDAAIDQIPLFWGSANANLKIADLPNVSNIVSSHSYWSDDSAKNMYTTRVNLKNTMEQTDPNLEFFQTEYSMLGGGYAWGHPGSGSLLTEIETAMSLARMLHVDFVVAEATGWHWWTVFEQGNHGGESRFALIEALTLKDLSDGVYNDTKLLYTLGNYSRFVRPGMKRIGVTRSDNKTEQDALSTQMYSAYLDEANQRVVVIATNSEATEASINLNITNLGKNVQFTPYITSSTQDLEVLEPIQTGETFTMPALSIVTFVSEPVIPANTVSPVQNAELRIFPNPVVDELTIRSDAAIKSVVMYDLYGRRIAAKAADNMHMLNMTTAGLPEGIYMVRVETENGCITRNVIKSK